ncbi:MAG TPA: efflux RND transporter permease subunit [Firmicutes bacterium]|nr:efflux RND transporter permease subunit [Bacillota bacterium]
MKLANFSVNRPVAITMVVLVILMVGFVSLSGLYVDLLPEMNFPIAIVLTSYTGSAPQEVETLISKPLEEVLGTVSNIKNIHSMSSLGDSVVVAEFEMGTDMDFASLEMREKIDMVGGYLPKDAGDPMVMQMDINMMPVLLLAVSGDRPLAELKSITEDIIKPRLERQDGVAQVQVIGGLTREVQVIIEPEKLNAFGLSITNVVQALQAQNMNLSAGLATRGSQEMALRVIGEYSAVEEIAATSLMTSQGALLRLDDVAHIEDGHKDTTALNRSGDKAGILLTVQKQSGSNTVSVVRNARQVLQELEETQLPADIATSTVMDQAEFIEFVIQNVYQNLFYGALLAMLVLFIFLRNLRSTFIIALSMPISVITTFILIYFGKLTLNMMTLGGLALGIGMMVDSSIVVLENIFRFRERGLDQIEAAKTGTAEVANAITASVLTTVAVFFPIVFLKGIASEIFTDLALTVSFSLFSSLLVALTLIPMLSSRLLKVGWIDSNSAGDVNGAGGKGGGLAQRIFRSTGKWFGALDEFYRKILAWCLRRRMATVGIIVVLLLSSLLLVPGLGAEFIPAMDQGMISVSVELPRGSCLEETDKVIRQVEESFQVFEKDIELVFSSVGSSGSGGMGMGGGSNMGSIYVTLTPVKERTLSVQEIVEGVRNQVASIPGAEIQVTAADMGFSMLGLTTPLELNLKGDDFERLGELSARAAELVRSVPGTREVTTSLEEGQAEIHLLVNRERAAIYGLSAAQIASEVRTSIEGQVATRYRTGSEEIDVRVRLSDDGRREVTEIAGLQLSSPLGFMVPLGEVAEIEEQQAPSTISRSNQVRVVSINAQLDGTRDLATVIGDAEAIIAEKLILPPGYTLEFGGEFELMSDAFGDLLLALLMAIALVYMIMAAQFESLLHPFVIMFSLPVTVIGVLVALFLTGVTFNVVTFIGVIMLAGIVVNNGIILVDYINQLRQRGMERDEAILMAGPTRLRPILMTALTTILAMVPLAFGRGEGAEMQASMSVAVVGGLTTSTFLTLLFVPVIYSLFDDLRHVGRGRRRARRSQAGAPS